MTTTYQILIGAFGLAVVIGACLIELPPDKGISEELFEAQRQSAVLEAKTKNDYEQSILKSKIRIAELTFGDAFADQYAHCLLEPPSKPANQKRCATTIARLEKHLADMDAADAKAKANW